MRATGTAAICAGLALLFTAGLARPEEAAGPASRVERGEDLYRIYCRTCHGDEGAGNGPTGPSLSTRPPDLRRLASGNDGEFPVDRVYATIDARDHIESHRVDEMPIWGYAFQELDMDVNQEAQVRERIDDLIRYLRSIQVHGRGRGRNRPEG